MFPLPPLFDVILFCKTNIGWFSSRRGEVLHLCPSESCLGRNWHHLEHWPAISWPSLFHRLWRSEYKCLWAMEFSDAHLACLWLQKIEAQRPCSRIGRMCNSFLSPQSSLHLRGPSLGFAQWSHHWLNHFRIFRIDLMIWITQRLGAVFMGRTGQFLCNLRTVWFQSSLWNYYLSWSELHGSWAGRQALEGVLG